LTPLAAEIELTARDRDERECGCLDQIKAIGDSRKDAGLNSTQLRVSMEGPGKHVISHGELAHVRTKANNGSGEVPTDDGRELDAQRRFCCTGPLPKINRIDTRRRHSDENLAFAGYGIGNVFVLQDVGAAVLMHHHRFSSASLL
jgi:hypothetical protein